MRDFATVGIDGLIVVGSVVNERLFNFMINQTVAYQQSDVDVPDCRVFQQVKVSVI